MNILIVDDHPATLKLLRAVLESEGTTVCEAVDGIEALDVLRRKPVDGIISDILMPRMDGYRLCKEIRANRRFAELPFIAYTATYASDGDEKVMADMGADRFLRKPVSAAILTSALEDVLNSKRLRSLPSAATRSKIALLDDCNERPVAKLNKRNGALETRPTPTVPATSIELGGIYPLHPSPNPLALPLDAQADARVEGDHTRQLRLSSQLALHHAATVALARSGSVPEIGQKILAEIGLGLDWAFGELWIVDRSAQLLRCAQSWHLPLVEFRQFAANEQQRTFSRGKGLPGQVWSSGQLEWHGDLTQAGACPDPHRVSPLGLRGWVGFPVTVRHEVVGVIGFFSERLAQPDDDLRALLGAIGLQMGQFIERQQLGDQLQLARKMEAIGAEAIGVAHDINNILGGIYGFCEMARIEAGSNTSVTAHLNAAIGGTRRATELVHQILKSTHRPSHERRPLHLRPIVEEVLGLLRATVPMSVEFLTSLDNSVPIVLANGTQVHQVLMNLGTNAVYAMREGGGRLTVKLEDCHVDAALSAAHPDLRIGRYARLTVQDTGHGMDAETLVRMYEPLFTTKPPGEGTGIGLVVVRGIVKSHQGAIVASSSQGKGTTFLVYFPQYPAKVEVAKTEIVAPPRTEAPRGAGERILFVDDEKRITDVGKLVLDHMGYVTVTCSDPLHALELLSVEPCAYALLITDQNMPGMTGTDLARRLSILRPGLPIILTTGNTGSLIPDQLRAIGIRQLLAKPFSVHGLTTAVHHTLSTRDAGKP